MARDLRKRASIPEGNTDRVKRRSRRDIALREKTLWRILHETYARTGELLGINIEDLDHAGTTQRGRAQGVLRARNTHQIAAGLAPQQLGVDRHDNGRSRHWILLR